MAKTDGDIVFKDEAVIKVTFWHKQHAEQHRWHRCKSVTTRIYLLHILMLFENFSVPL